MTQDLLSKRNQVKSLSREDYDRAVLDLCTGVNAALRSLILSVPRKYRLSYARALKVPTARALAVRMKCIECVGFEDIQDRVGGCTVRGCPLWLHRPFQDGLEEDSPLPE